MNTRSPAKFGGRAAKGAAAAKAAAAAGKPRARRGEEDEPETALEELPESGTAFPHQAEPATRQAVVLQPSQVTLSGESTNALVYVAPPEDADARDQVAHHRRRIIVANRELTLGMGQLEKSYVLSAGVHFWEATSDNKRLKEAGYKSVDEFAATIDMTKQDVYRVRRAVPVYQVIGDMVEEPLNERTIRALYSTLTNEKKDYDPTPERQQNLRLQFDEMRRAGKVNSSGALWARNLLQLGPDAAPMEIEPENGEPPEALLKLAKARKAGRLVDLELLKEAKEQDQDAVEGYVNELRERYEAAAALLQG